MCNCLRRRWEGPIALGLPVLFWMACAPGTGSGPGNPDELSVTADIATPAVSEGAQITLTVEAGGGSPPYLYRWDVNTAPVEVELSEQQATSAQLVIESIATAGRYVFRVTVTDSVGERVHAFVTVEVTPGVSVAASTDTPEAFQGSSVTLTATVTDGTEPFSYQWNLDDGPIDVDTSEATSENWTTPELTEPGQYIFSVTVTDDVGFDSVATVAIEVLPAVTASAPKCAVINQPVGLTADISDTADVTAIVWEVLSGSAVIEGEADTEATLTATAMDEDILVRLTVTLAGADDSTETTTLDFTIEPVDELHPHVLLQTNVGDFTIELDGAAAPMHMESFLAYVDEGFYDGVLFHRSAAIIDEDLGAEVPFVLQGGGYTRVDGELELKEPTRDPVESEADNGLSNGDPYTVSLALSGLAPGYTTNDPDSGSSQFFINLAENSFLDEQGFTVFGRIIEGTDVVDTIAAMETTDSTIIPGEVSQPVEDVIMESVTRACE